MKYVDYLGQMYNFELHAWLYVDSKHMLFSNYARKACLNKPPTQKGKKTFNIVKP